MICGVRGKVVEQINGNAAEQHIDKLAKNTWEKTNIQVVSRGKKNNTQDKI
jgi:hypothetical protein